MVTRAPVSTLSGFQSSDAQHVLVVSAETNVMDAIALLSGLAAPTASHSNQSVELDNPPTVPEHPPHCLLVQEAGELAGILTSQDVMRLLVQKIPLEDLVIGQVMSHPVITLNESALTNIEQAIHLLDKHKIRYLPVVNDHGGFVRLLTYKNLCQAVLAQTVQPVETIPSESTALIPHTPVGIFKTNATGACTDVNARWCEIAGLTPETALGDGWRQGLHPEDRERISAEWYQSTQEHRSFKLEYRFQSPAGKVTWVYGQSIAEKDEKGQIIGYIGTITDISDRKQAEELLHQSEERYRSIYDQAAVGFVNATPEGVLLDINPCFCQMLGYTRAELLKKTVLDITHPEDRARFAPAQTQLFEEQLPYIVQEKRYLRKDGSYFWAKTCVSIVRDHAGQAKYDLAVIQDISDRKATELALNHVIAGTAATMGKDFFPALVQHIAQALNVDYVILSEQQGEQLQMLAFWGDGALQSNSALPLANAPCERVLTEGTFYSSQGLQAQFPKCEILQTLEAESYLGIALKNSDGTNIGHLCILNRQSMLSADQNRALLTVFAARAAAELERQKVLSQLEALNANLEQTVDERTGALLEREARYRALMEGASDAIIVVDMDGNILEANCKAEALFGYSRQQLTQMFHNDLYPSESRDTINSALRDWERENLNSIQNLEVIRADHQKILVDVSGKTVQVGHETLLQEIFRDVTEREKAKTVLEAQKVALQEREQFLTTILNTFPFPIFWKDLNSIYLGGNCHYLKDTNLSKIQDLVGKSDYDLPWSNKAAEIYRAHDQEVIKSGTAIRSILQTQLRPDQKLRWFESHKIPLRNIHGKTIGVVGMYQDISDRKQAELELQRTNKELARATRLKNEFLANMSHELRTPLHAIQGMTEGLKEHVLGEVNEQQIQALQTIENSSIHLLELINDILDVAKIEAGQVKLNLTPTTLSSLCQSSLAFIKQQAQKKSIRVQFQAQPELPIVLIDSRRIRQTLINLLSNAVKFTPDHGSIHLEVNYCAPAQDSAVEALGKVTLTVRDNGIGIAPEEISRLFQPFVQIDSALNRQYQGTGLGLALVRRIAELHGGSVTLESSLGEGSCFTINLPCKTISAIADKHTPQSSLPPRRHSPAPPSSPRILLVEDNEDNILTLSTYLDAKGYQLLFAHNGLEAIAQTQAEQPDIILMDIQMPDMDGLEAIRRIRLDPKFSETPIIALTALAMKGDREECLAAGADKYLSKPVRLRQLDNTIQALLSSQSMS